MQLKNLFSRNVILCNINNLSNIIDSYINQLQEFLMKYRYILLISIFTGILINAVDIFTFKFGIDAENYSFLGDKSQYLYTNRLGNYVLYYLFPFARYQIVSQLIGIIALSLAGLLTISRHNIPNNYKLLFVLLFITFPNFTFLQYFYFQSAYNFIGLLFVVIAYRIIEKNRNIFLYILAISLLFVGITSYQSNLAVFLTVMMINIILDFINDKNHKKAFISMIKPVIILSIPMIIYLIYFTFTERSKYHNEFFKNMGGGFI